MFTSACWLISMCALFVATWASANLDDSCQSSTSRSLLQTHTQKNRPQEGSWPIGDEGSGKLSKKTGTHLHKQGSNHASQHKPKQASKQTLVRTRSSKSAATHKSKQAQKKTQSSMKISSSSATDGTSDMDPNLPRPADAKLQAPPEGGEFSKFFNSIGVGKGMHKWLHYFPAYQRHLKQFIGQEVHILEIGVSSGGSLAMWKEIFGPKAHVYGIDIDPQCKEFEDDQTKIFIGDQEDESLWYDFRSQVERIDIVIDDGGHSVEQLVATLGNTLPVMSPDGVYLLEGASEDLWLRTDHPIWMYMHFEDLTSPEGKKYEHFGSLISSVHVYPYLMAIELRENANPDAMNRQLAYNPNQKPRDIVMLTAEAPNTWAEDGQKGKKRGSPQMMLSNADLDAAFPWLEWKDHGMMNMTEDMVPFLSKAKPNSWIMVRDPNEEFSFDSPWNDQADIFLNRINARFIGLHKGLCCHPEPNRIQEKVGSLHIYPHFFIVQTLSNKPKLAAPRHGTEWVEHDLHQESHSQEAEQGEEQEGSEEEREGENEEDTEEDKEEEEEEDKEEDDEEEQEEDKEEDDEEEKEEDKEEDEEEEKEEDKEEDEEEEKEEDKEEEEEHNEEQEGDPEEERKWVQ